MLKFSKNFKFKEQKASQKTGKMSKMTKNMRK